MVRNDFANFRLEPFNFRCLLQKFCTLLFILKSSRPFRKIVMLWILVKFRVFVTLHVVEISVTGEYFVFELSFLFFLIFSFPKDLKNVFNIRLYLPYFYGHNHDLTLSNLLLRQSHSLLINDYSVFDVTFILVFYSFLSDCKCIVFIQMTSRRSNFSTSISLLKLCHFHVKYRCVHWCLLQIKLFLDSVCNPISCALLKLVLMLLYLKH